MAGELRAPLVVVEPLTEGDASVRAPSVYVEPLTEGAPLVRQSFLYVEPLTEGGPSLRQSFSYLEALSDAYRNLRSPFIFLEVMVPVWPEEYMSNNPFPTLPGLSFTWHKRPTFRTGFHSSASGVSVRNALMQYPIWEFEGTYEFLKDTVLEPQFEELCGFFLSRKGRYDSFLFKDGDDYIANNSPSPEPADGVTTMFSLSRTLGGFTEKIGQIDTDAPLTVYHTIPEAGTIPGSGPFTITVANAADFVADVGVTLAGTAMTKVEPGPPTAAGEYSVNATTGVYTFFIDDANAGVVITYRYGPLDPVDYTVTMPNRIVFGTAPSTGIISASFEFFFRCIFKEDLLDFEKFADKFWELQTIEFESLPA